MRKKKNEPDYFETHGRQRYVSEMLWHFPGRHKNDPLAFKILKSILQEQKLRRGPEEKLLYYDPHKNKREILGAYPVCCLADIPLKDLPFHADRYMRFAIGFHKRSALKAGFSPVMYVNQSSQAMQHFFSLCKSLEKSFGKKRKNGSKEFQDLLLTLGSFVKSGLLSQPPKNDPKLDKYQLNNFYYEREWRALEDWRFKPEDVALIIVEDKRYVEFMKLRKTIFSRYASTPALKYSMLHQI